MNNGPLLNMRGSNPISLPISPIGLDTPIPFNSRGILGLGHGSGSNFGSDGALGSQHTRGQIFYQICSKSSHGALDCYQRMNFSYQGRHPPSQLAAMAVNSMNTQSSAKNSNGFWLSDSGCNIHMTNSLANLNLSNNYNGDESITVGNGQPIKFNILVVDTFYLFSYL